MATITAPYPRRLPMPAPPPPSLLQFLLLSILLHVLVVLVLGTPERTGGGPLGAWRDVPFAVTIRSLAGERESPWRPSYGGDQGTTGSSLARGVPASAPASAARPLPPPPAAPAPEPPAARESMAPGALPRLDEGAPEIVDKAIRPEPQLRPQEPEQEPATPAVPRVDLEPARTAEPEAPPKRETLAPLPPITERPTPPANAPVALPKLESPTPLEAPAEALPRIELEPPPKREAPAEAQPEAMPKFEPRIATPAPPVTTPAPPVTTPAPPPAATREPPATPAPPRESAPAPVVDQPIAPAAPAVTPRDAPQAPAAPLRESAPTADRESPHVAPAETPAIPRLRYGAPEDDIFAPRTPSSAIDADAARKAVRETARADSRRSGIVPLNLLPTPPEPESKLGRAIQKAAQPDCRDAYAAMGLLAIPFLLKDTVTDTGCRW